MEIRSANLSDLESIHALLAGAGLPADGVADHLGTFLVCEDREEVIAVGGLEVFSDVALVRSVAVIEARRGGGTGSRICRALIARARELGVSHCYLLTETAEGFFASLGFSPIAREEAPPAIRSTREFSELCPESCRLMRLEGPGGG